MARGQNCMLQSDIHIHVDTHMHGLILTHIHTRTRTKVLSRRSVHLTAVVTSQKSDSVAFRHSVAALIDYHLCSNGH